MWKSAATGPFSSPVLGQEPFLGEVGKRKTEGLEDSPLEIQIALMCLPARKNWAAASHWAVVGKDLRD